MTTPRLAGIVLAAGQSSRMGRSKALLHVGTASETFVERLIRTMFAAGLDEVIVVGRAGDGALRQAVDRAHPAVRYVENPAPERGQLSSLVVGMDDAASRGAAGVLAMPVDIPLVRIETIAAAVNAFRAGMDPIIRVSCAGRHGHPVVFRADMFAALRVADMAAGAKAVIRAHAGRVLELHVEDPGILHDVDVPEDYRRLFGRGPE